MPSKNLVKSDKVQYLNGDGTSVGGGEIHHAQPWFPDERDRFISWLRSEFAAANAIIDGLCHHLRSVGEPGEYDLLIDCVHQRRLVWSSVLHMQQYLPVKDILHALQQVAWKRQHRLVEQDRVGGKECNRSSERHFGCRQGQNIEYNKELRNLNANGQNLHANTGSSDKKVIAGEEDEPKLGHDAKNFDDESFSNVPNVTGNSSLLGKNGDHDQNQSNETITVLPQTFIAMETYDGKMVNVAEGLNLYDKVLDEARVLDLLSLSNDLRATGICGQLPGSTFVVSKRPHRGHGRETIQLGVAISGALPSDDNPAKAGKRVEPIPGLLQDLIDRLISMQVLPLKPDSCVIDIFKEGDHSQPHAFPAWYGRPICLLSLNDCDMVFGAVISSDHGGTFRGAHRLSLAPGSLLVMQGNSADVAKRAIPSTPKQRTLITFLKLQPAKEGVQGDGQRLHTQGSKWNPSANHFRPKQHYTHPAGQQIRTPANSIPQLYVAPPPSVAFPVSAAVPPSPPGGWLAATCTHPLALTRLPASGTGFFLPSPGFDHLSPRVETSSAAGIGLSSTGDGKVKEMDVKKCKQERNGGVIDEPKLSKTAGTA